MSDDASSLTLPSDRASVCGGTGACELEHVGFGTKAAASQRGAGWKAALALWWRSECVHLSLAKDAAVTADGVVKSLTCHGGSSYRREHGGTGAGALVEITFRPVPISTASGGGRKAASGLRVPRA